MRSTTAADAGFPAFLCGGLGYCNRIFPPWLVGNARHGLAGPEYLHFYWRPTGHLANFAIFLLAGFLPFPAGKLVCHSVGEPDYGQCMAFLLCSLGLPSIALGLGQSSRRPRILMNYGAAWTARIPGALVSMPAWPMSTTLLFLASLFFLSPYCLWKARDRWTVAGLCWLVALLLCLGLKWKERRKGVGI